MTVTTMKASACSSSSASRSASARSRPGQRAVEDGVDAEQRLGQAEPLHDRARRGARAEDVQRARAHAGDDLGGDVVQRPLLAGHATGLGALREAARYGYAHEAVEVRGDAVLAEGLLVDVHDLALAQPDGAGRSCR